LKVQWFLIFGGLLSFLSLLPACSSNQPGTYPTLKQTQLRISREMTSFRNSAIWGRLTLGEKERGNAAYSTYRTAYDEALRAANGNDKAPAPENVIALANEAIRVISAIPK